MILVFVGTTQTDFWGDQPIYKYMGGLQLIMRILAHEGKTT